MCLLHARAVYGSVVVFHGIGQTQLLQVIEYIYIYIYSIYIWVPNTYKVPTIMLLGPFE